MTPTTTQTITVSAEEKDICAKLPSSIGTDPTFKREIAWVNAIGFLILHLCGFYGMCLSFYYPATSCWCWLLGFAYTAGVTIGAHRLYSHKCFKATPITKLILLMLQAGSGQNSLYTWVRDHRQHHKYSDTDADPHNANRGFFFSHIGWLMSKKHPLVIEKGKGIDMSDLDADQLVVLQKKYFQTLYFIFGFALPIWVPCYFWNETLWNSIFIAYFFRSCLVFNGTWCVNSVAHFYGTKPFDSTIRPVDSRFVFAIGEGWHNYHHSFPWDYRAAEFGTRYSFSTFVIDILAEFGMAYDLREAPYKMVEHRAVKKGDGSHPIFGKKAHL